MLFLRKHDDGTLEPFEISDLGEGELGELRLSEADLAIVLSEQDVLENTMRTSNAILSAMRVRSP